MYFTDNHYSDMSGKPSMTSSNQYFKIGDTIINYKSGYIYSGGDGRVIITWEKSFSSSSYIVCMCETRELNNLKIKLVEQTATKIDVEASTTTKTLTIQAIAIGK